MILKSKPYYQLNTATENSYNPQVNKSLAVKREKKKKKRSLIIDFPIGSKALLNPSNAHFQSALYLKHLHKYTSWDSLKKYA